MIRLDMRTRESQERAEWSLTLDQLDRPFHLAADHQRHHPTTVPTRRESGTSGIDRDIRETVTVTDLAGAHIVITGGSEGIGLEVARAAHQRAARVSLIARRADVLEAAAASIGTDVAWAAADVSDPSAIERAIGEVVATHGAVEVLVACAGYATPGYFSSLATGEFHRHMDVNYFGALHAVRAVTPAMVASGRGHLVVVSSTAGILGVFGYSAYSPTKFALRGLGEVLRAELGPVGIQVSVAYPPDTVTPGFDRENLTKPPETIAISGAIKAIPAHRTAAAIVSGIERDRWQIFADPLTAVLAHSIGLIGPIVRRVNQTRARRAAARVSD